MSAPVNMFPDDWIWGAATAAYQIEGASREGGRGPSIWDTFSHTPGRVLNGDTGDIACDHYYRTREDIDLMRELGLGAYRFSISWPRIFPSGSGRPNQAGLDFYHRLVEDLHAADIEPWITLYHWDLPQALQDKGGWTNRDTAHRFAELANTVVEHLGSEVHHWFTINEPWVAAFLGHWQGIHAPGARDLRTALLAAHNLLLAHGEGMLALRSEMRQGDEAGIVLNLSPVHPADDSNADLEAAERMDGYLNRWFLDALYRGAYPDDMVRLYGEAMPEIAENDMALIAQPTDFLGINYYTRTVVAYDRRNVPLEAAHVVPAGAPVTATGWEIYPRGIREIVARVDDDYGPPRLIIAENGAAFDDVLIDGRVADPRRESYLRAHLEEVLTAAHDGVPVAGYFVWSLLDNFEWAWGYATRFGIVYVDYATQERILKQSGRWYAETTRENGLRA